MTIVAAGVLVATLLTAPQQFDILPVAVFAAAFVVVQFLPVPIPRGSELDLFHFDEVVLVPLVLLLQPHEALVAAAGGLAIAQVLSRVERIKFVFNVSEHILSTALILVIVVAIAGPAPGGTNIGMLAAALGVAAMFALNQLLVSGVIALASDAKLRPLLFDDLAFRIIMASSNVALGLILTLPLVHAPWMLVGTLIPLLVLHTAYRALVERAHEDRNLAKLRGYAQSLMESLRVEDAAQGLVRSARELVGADSVELRIRGDHHAYVSDRDGERIVPAETVPLGASRRSSDVEFPLSGRSGLKASLFVRSPRTPGPSGPFSEREAALLDMLVRQAQIGLDNAWLFQRVTTERTTLAQIFEHSSEGLAVLGCHGDIKSWNPAMQRITGYAATDVVGSQVAFICPDLARIPQTGGSGTLESVATTRHNEDRCIQAYYAEIPPTDHESDEPLWVVVINDSTAERETQRMKDDFVATVSHELRTPLTAIKGFLATMQRDDIVIEPERLPEFLDIMSDQTERLERLVVDLLDISALESGSQIQLSSDEVELDPLLVATVRDFRAARPDVRIEVSRADGLVVLADAGRLQQVLMNLLDNARKHAGDDGPIEIDCIVRDSHAAIQVHDHGQGIPADDLERIFERFYISANSVTRNGGGAGLGLYICRRLVEAMGGSIDVTSIPGRGSTFTVSLPLSAAATDETLQESG